MTAASSAGETGMIVELDVAPLLTWLAELYRLKQPEMAKLLGETPAEMRQLAEQNRTRMLDGLRRLQGLCYRKWLADGKARTSLHVRIAAAKE